MDKQDDAADGWRPTCRLRWLSYPGGLEPKKLQQLWVEIDPNEYGYRSEEWRDIEIV